MAKTTYVIDTNVYLTDANCIYKFGRNDILLPIKVLEEIDKHKKRQDGLVQMPVILFVCSMRFVRVEVSTKELG